MNGDELLLEFERRIMKYKRTKTVSDSVLAKYLGVTQPQLANYRGKDLTAKQVANLVEKYAKAEQKAFISGAVVPIVEFLEIYLTESPRGAAWQIFLTEDDGGDYLYYKGLKKSLDESHGIYIFHDSRGRAIYAGKAQKLSLWVEMNNAFNRQRGEVQNIKRVSHPQGRTIRYQGFEEKKRKIVKQEVALHNIASYCSAYSVPDALIGKFEALIVRTFANDLLNVRMENF